MSHTANDILLDNFKEHHPDCQQYNFNDRFYPPIITDCICDLAEKRDMEESKTQNQIRAELGD